MDNFDPHPVDVRFFPNTPEQVLLIDDEEAFLRLASAMLRRAGYASTCAQDSNTAQELLRTTKYHLIIADIRMPGNTNLELIRLLPQLTDMTPVILVTGYPSVESAAQAIQLPVVAYLTKPFAYEDFLSAVRLGLERNRLAQAMARMKQRLQNWSQDLTQLEHAMSWMSSSNTTSQAETLQLLTLQNITETLKDLKLTPDSQPDSVVSLLPQAATLLSRREREILQTLLTHHRVALIARYLQISPNTVRNHLKAIFRKFGVHSQSELLDYLRQHPPSRV